MARMRLMRDGAAGTLVAVCVYCDATAAPDMMRTQYCACRSGAEDREMAATTTGGERAA